MRTRAPKKKQSLTPNTVLIIRQVLVGVLIFSFIAMLLLSMWYGTRIDKLTLSSVVVQGGVTIPHARVRENVERLLAGEYLKFIPRAFALTYPQEEIIASISTIERIKNVRVERSSGTTLLVSFDEYFPDALWCTDDEETCYFVDETGYAFSPAPSLKGESFLRIVTPGTLATSSTQVLQASDYEIVNSLALLLDSAGWPVRRASVDIAGDVFLELSGGGELKVNVTQPPEETVENFLMILNSKEFAHLAPDAFEYIDLRFGNKVFVKEFPDEVSATSTATTTENIDIFE